MYSLPPIDPLAFGGLPKATEGGALQEGGPQGAPPMDMNKYLIDKVMEIKRRMGSGGGDGDGALGAISDAMMQQPQAQPQQGEPMPTQQPPMGA